MSFLLFLFQVGGGRGAREGREMERGNGGKELMISRVSFRSLLNVVQRKFYSVYRPVGLFVFSRMRSGSAPY